jgi:6-pyruvoyltetrahydropterin/6-carboxytetrahydropterin synthase
MHTANRYHDISCGHRVVGHEGKCRHLHGHNYRIHFTCEAALNVMSLDSIGRVIDFSEIKRRLCMWLEENWDHKFLVWDLDPMFKQISTTAKLEPELAHMYLESIVRVPFNPTAENIAQHLVEVIGPRMLKGTGILLTQCVVEETRKCSASFSLRNDQK